MTRAQIAALLASTDPGALRIRAGISLRTIALALDTNRNRIWRWENRHREVTGDVGAAYARFIAGLARHEAVTWEGRPTGTVTR